MIRRRRPQREIAFSFDSFLDVVANVVGIILRLILVAWVGARTYKANVPLPPPPEMAEEEEIRPTPAQPTDPLAANLTARQKEVVRSEERLKEQLEAGTEVERQTAVVSGELSAATARRKQLEKERMAQAQADGNKPRPVLDAAATLAEMTERSRKVRAEIEAVAKIPSAKQTLRYRTPVSRPVQTDELMFEIREGRVTLIDVGTMLDEIQRDMRDKSELLKHQWQVEDDTRSVGAFRLHYVIERERSAVEGISGLPSDRVSFRYGLGGWEVVPIDPKRGETPEQALAPGSTFRRTIDSIDPNQTAVTFWVYPDSFAAYRRLRDALHDRDVVVAGRPLPMGYPIASTKHGTSSRGQ